MARNYSISRTQKASQVINIICGATFAVFCFCFLTFYQNDFLALVQHYYSDGRNVSHGLAFPIFITIGLTGLGTLLHHFVHVPIRQRAVMWFPSCQILSILCSFSVPSFTNPSDSAGIVCHILFLLLTILIIFIATQFQESRNENTSLSVLAWPNLCFLAIGFAFATGCANTNARLHQELCFERAMGEGRYADALAHFENESCSPSRFYTAMAAYALEEQGRLGEEFFRYARLEGSDALLPLPVDSVRPWNPVRMFQQHLGDFPLLPVNGTRYLENIESDTIQNTHLQQYLMTAYLLDRNLPSFVNRLLMNYPPLDSIKHIYLPEDSLPRNYAEALVLYARTTEEKPLAQLQDSVLMQQYDEFCLLQDSIGNSPHPEEIDQSKYSKTYWNYFHAIKEEKKEDEEGKE